MTTPMLPAPPDCGSPCAMCESYAHLLAKAREEVARLQMELDSTCNAEELRQTRADNDALRNSHAAIYLALGGNESNHTKWPAQIVALRAALDPERIIAAIQLPGGHYCDPQAVADAIRAYCGAALAAHGNPTTEESSAVRHQDWARSLWRLVRCVRALGLSKGVRYWRIENLCIAEPAFALKLADALESEALLHEAGGVTKYVPCLRGFAADIRRHHAAFTANIRNLPRDE